MGVEGRKHDILGAEEANCPVRIRGACGMSEGNSKRSQSLRNYLHLLSANVRL
jgi:hypothetical protein